MRTFTITINLLPIENKNIHEAVTLMDDGGYMMIVNENDSQERQIRSIIHGLQHVYHDDFTSSRPVPEIEKERREELRRILEEVTL